MRTIRVETAIAAHAEKVFDLALDLEEHARSAAVTDERIVETSACGPRLEEGDTVTFEARHFGLRWRMTARVTLLSRPSWFIDEQVRGPFRSFRHEHRFEPQAGGTLMIDLFSFSAPLGWLTEPLLAKHLERFLRRRADYLRHRAESGGISAL